MSEELGQVPANDGQAPSTQVETTPQAQDTTPQAGAVQTPQNAQPKTGLTDVKALQEALDKARQDAAKYRTERNTFELENKTLKDAQLTAEQKAAQELEDLRNFKATHLTEKQTLVLERDLLAAAYEAGMGAKAKSILRLADRSVIEFQDGQPSQDSIATAINAVKAELPELFKGTSLATPPPSGDPVNAGKSKLGLLTKEQIMRMTPQEAARAYADGSMQKAIDAGVLN